MSKSKKAGKTHKAKPSEKPPAKTAKAAKKQAKPKKVAAKKPAPQKPARRPPPMPPSEIELPAARPAPVRRRPEAAAPAMMTKPPVVRVRHAIFGVGKLVRELPEGKIEVLFEKVGRKTLLSTFVEVLPPIVGA